MIISLESYVEMGVGNMSLFSMKITELPKIGPKTATLYERLGVHSVGELIRMYPRTYEDLSNPVSISEAQSGETVCIKAHIVGNNPPVRVRGGMIIYKITVSDDESQMTITFFNQQYMYDKLKYGGEFLFYGVFKKNINNFEMASPVVLSTESDAIIHPIYKQTGTLTSRKIEAAMREALKRLPEKTNDPIPENIREKFGLCSLDFAIRNIHFPADIKALETAKKRLTFEELLVLQLGMVFRKNSVKKETPHKITQDFTEDFYKLLSFSPTSAQKRAISECISDMKTDKPMTRLVQGDVGSGKTAVGAACCYTAVMNGLQCAFMAPTELLATQHYNSLCQLFENSGINIALLTGSLTAAKKRAVYSALKSGEVDIAVGTHALFSKGVEFNRLGLIITDEQHRFGVAQRAELLEKGESPHLLVMSATPIPRTLALMIFGDLDLSILDELPPGRQKISTYLIDSTIRPRALNFMKKHIDNGNQCYIVCPLVEENDTNMASVEEYAERLKDTALGSCRIAVLHGKMKTSKKDEIMTEFKNGNIDVLVSTTVIEVGVDVPNAVIMMIENAERFGLSQLHQLRGRVGRGTVKSHCILVSDAQNEGTLERLKIMCKTNDGFKLADEDLRMRGPGDFFGSRQHGLPDLKIAGLSSMVSINDAKEAAEMIIADDPTLSEKQHRPLAFEVKRLFSSVGGTLN